jgi:3-dehydroquinate synthase
MINKDLLTQTQTSFLAIGQGSVAKPSGTISLDTHLIGGVPYFLGHGSLHAIRVKLEEFSFDKLFLITSPNVWRFHGEGLYNTLESFFPCELVMIPDEEANKNISTLNRLCEELIARRVSKDSILLSLGGGVIGNIVGLAAALVYRGVRFAEIPTTLIAQTDSCLSNKQGINGIRGKNHFGVYYAPIFIWSDCKVLLSESLRGRRSGLAESIKNGLISDPLFLLFLEDALKGGLALSEEAIQEVVFRSAISKIRILEQDPTEKHYGVILEYGHTIGHALERLCYGKIMHGEAIAVGMMAEARISRDLGMLSHDEVARHEYLLGDLLGMDLYVPPGLSVEAILETIEMDNKRSSRGIRYILLEQVGQVANPNGDYLMSVDRAVVAGALSEMLAAN